jgi:polysaccharide export outer membrane protein
VQFRSQISLLFCILLIACGGAKTKIISTGERYQASVAQVEDYKLGVGDKVKLTLFNEPTLSGEFSVNASGSLSLPLIGDVPVVGKGVTEITDALRKLYGDGYVRDPKVNLEVTTYRPFFVLGEVRQPGQYPYAVGMTATNAIALAQGYTPRAVKSSIYIRRAGSADEQAFKLSPELRVLPGDTLRVSERYF